MCYLVHLSYFQNANSSVKRNHRALRHLDKQTLLARASKSVQGTIASPSATVISEATTLWPVWQYGHHNETLAPFSRWTSVCDALMEVRTMFSVWGHR